MKSKNVENELIYEECLKGLSMGLADLINEKENELASNDKLIYAACSNQDAKDKYTNSELNKIAKKLKKANPTVSSYSVEILIYESSLNTNIDFNEFIILLCSNYLRENHEAIMQFSIFYNSIEEIQNDYYDGFMSRVLLGEMAELHKEFNYSEIREFIKYMALSLRNVILKSFLNDNKIESKGQSNIFVKDATKTEQPSNVSYYEFNKLIKYFNYANCHNKTPIDLYHLFDLNFKGFKGEVLTNLISIPSDGKISYLELRKNILEEEYLHLNPDKSIIVALFQKYKLSENEFQNDKINDLKANNFFHDYITTDNDYRNDIDKPEVDEIHGVIFNYYAGIAKNKAIEFIDIQLQKIDPNHMPTSIISLTNAHNDQQINDVRLNDTDYVSMTNQICNLLSRYYNYTSKGDLAEDLNYLYSLGFDDSKCSSPGHYCPNCILPFVRYKTQINLIRQNLPFATYRDKLNFIINHDDLFEALNIQTTIDGVFFSTYPQNEEESDIYVAIVFELNESENKNRRINGQKQLQGIPIVSFNELKCLLYQNAKKSPEPKVLLQYEFQRILNLFPKDDKLGIASIFWYIHDLKITSERHLFKLNDLRSSLYLKHGALVDHYVNYYFYLKKIIEGSSQSFVDDVKFISFDFIYFNINKVVLLSQEKKEEILYSGKYIEQVCCLKPISFLSKIFTETKITDIEYNIIFNVFTNHGFWDFAELKYNQTKSDPDNSHMGELVKEIFSISEKLFDCRKKFLSEFKNLVLHANDHHDYSLLIAEFKAQFQKEFDKNFSPIPTKVKKELSKIDYFLKIINPDDFRLRNEFGKLSINHANKTDGRIEQANLFFIYDRLNDVFIEAKEFIRTELMSFDGKFTQKIFLEDLREKLIYTKFYNLEVELEKILKPIGVSFFDLFETPDKSLQIYHELKFSISLDNSNPESIRLVEQKIDFYRQILSFWRSKAIEFIDNQLSDLLSENNQINIVPDKNDNPLGSSESISIDNLVTDSGHKKKTTRKPTTTVLSFSYKKYPRDHANLNKLYNRLKLKGFLKDDTALKDFKAAFSNVIIENKIIWHGNISELAFFIKVLHNEAKKVEDTKQKQWEITINCFVIPADQLPLTKDRLRGQKTPASSIKIEEAVNLL